MRNSFCRKIPHVRVLSNHIPTKLIFRLKYRKQEERRTNIEKAFSMDLQIIRDFYLLCIPDCLPEVFRL